MTKGFLRKIAALLVSSPVAVAQVPTTMVGVIHSTVTLREAVTAWCSDRQMAKQYYGHISYWLTGNVDDMSFLFSRYSPGWRDVGGAYCKRYHTFADDLSRWDVRNSRTFEGMFAGARNFNSPLSGKHWKPISATTLNGMFAGCISFNQAIGHWPVSTVRDLSWMFDGASDFNQALPWDVSLVESFRGTFNDAIAFNQSSLTSWDVQSGADFRNM